jgi:cob(I)alamin adenosyltransferase
VLNRLSDYLFTLSRSTCKALNVEEKVWISKA